MKRSELDQIEKYLRVVLGHDEVDVKNPTREDAPIEVYIGEDDLSAPSLVMKTMKKTFISLFQFLGMISNRPRHDFWP